MDLLINITMDLQSEMVVEVLLSVELKLSYMPFMLMCLHQRVHAFNTSTDQSLTMVEMAGMEVTVPVK